MGWKLPINPSNAGSVSAPSNARFWFALWLLTVTF